jgi:hypothetical protein
MRLPTSCLAVSVILVLTAGCGMASATTTAPIDAFENWRSAIIDGDFDETFELMSPSLKSHWIFLIYTPTQTREGLKYHELAKEFTGKLTDEQMEEFMAWLRQNRMEYATTQQVTPLPDTILDEKWTEDLLRRWFELSHRHLKHEFKGLKLKTEAAQTTEDNLVTLIVQNLRGKQEFYVMILDDDGWKVNYHRSGPPQ